MSLYVLPVPCGVVIDFGLKREAESTMGEK